MFAWGSRRVAALVAGIAGSVTSASARYADAFPFLLVLIGLSRPYPTAHGSSRKHQNRVLPHMTSTEHRPWPLAVVSPLQGRSIFPVCSHNRWCRGGSRPLPHPLNSPTEVGTSCHSQQGNRPNPYLHDGSLGVWKHDVIGAMRQEHWFTSIQKLWL